MDIKFNFWISGGNMKEDSRYKPKRFLKQVAELDPISYVRILKAWHKSGRAFILYNDCSKIWKEYKVKKGIVYYWIYNRSGKVIKRGIEK